MVVTLGINDGHNAGAALVKDGQVVAAVQEERLVNVKNYSGVPKRAIKAVYDIAKINPADTDVISIVSLNRVYAPLKEMPFKVRMFLKLSPLLNSHAWSSFYVKHLHKYRPMKELDAIFAQLGISDKELIFVEHQQAHAACAHYSKPNNGKKNLVLTTDGSGDGLSSTVSIGTGKGIKRIAATTYYDSLGNTLYSEVTRVLGLKPWEHEYKVMGMAPYGKAEYCIDQMRKIIRINPRKPLEFQNTMGACGEFAGRKIAKMLRFQRFDNISAACQQHFEDLLSQWVKNAIKETGVNDIVCAGGLFLNVKANKVLQEMEEVNSTFFYPACDDSGTPVGAALEAYNQFCLQEGIKPKRVEIKDIYYGPGYDNDQIEAALKKKGLMKNAKFVKDIDGEIADLLVKGKIVSRYSGRVEWGPRALGNRSILADARDLKSISSVNFAIKKRDFWMPFAVSIKEERIKDYLVDARPSPYMVEAFDTTDKRDDILAGTHPLDRTARPQTVNKDWNPGYHKVITEFEKATGVGGVLNTSLNIHGYPLVGSPENAIFTFQNSGLKYIAMGNWMIQK